MFYTYRQNNVRGEFIGPHNVIIEAESATEAEAIFNGLGLVQGYCPCCGDRWSPSMPDETETLEDAKTWAFHGNIRYVLKPADPCPECGRDRDTDDEPPCPACYEPWGE